MDEFDIVNMLSIRITTIFIITALFETVEMEEFTVLKSHKKTARYIPNCFSCIYPLFILFVPHLVTLYEFITSEYVHVTGFRLSESQKRASLISNALVTRVSRSVLCLFSF